MKLKMKISWLTLVSLFAFCLCEDVAIPDVVPPESGNLADNGMPAESQDRSRRQSGPPVPPPTGLLVNSITQTGFIVRWNPASGITGNFISVREVGGDGLQDGKLKAKASKARITDLKPGTYYDIEVKSLNGARSSGSLTLRRSTEPEDELDSHHDNIVENTLIASSHDPASGSHRVTSSGGRHVVTSSGGHIVTSSSSTTGGRHTVITSSGGSTGGGRRIVTSSSSSSGGGRTVITSSGSSTSSNQIGDKIHDHFSQGGAAGGDEFDLDEGRSTGGTFFQDCHKSQETDLVILTDGSWSVGPQNFRKMQDFIISLAEAFSIGFDGVFIGMAQYSDDPRTEFNLNDHPTQESLIDAINNVPYKGGNTATGSALDYITDNLFKRENGARQGVLKTAVIITDGESILDDVTEPAIRLRESGVEVFSIGVGAALRSELEDIASKPSSQHVFSVENFDDIKNIKNILLKDVCKPIALCRDLLPPNYGSMSCSADKNVQDTFCTFTCNQHYELKVGSQAVGEPSLTRTCLKTGYWDAPEPICTPTICVELNPPQHGRYGCTQENRIGSVCTLTCDVGYQSHGDITPRCQSDSSWTSNNAGCVLVTCPRATPPGHGKVRCTDSNKYASQCSFSCKRGYEMDGESPATCQASGRWSRAFPTCSRITCSRLNNLDNGKTTCTDSVNFASKCSFECLEGYELLGSQLATCGALKKWKLSVKKQLPVCDRIRCGEPQLSDHVTRQCTDGNYYGSQCSFRCDVGYNLVGATNAECTGTKSLGDWTASSPTCHLVSCPIAEPSPNSEVLCTDRNNYRSKCNLLCNEGYELVADSLTTCSASGRWKGALSSCRRIECEELRPVTFGSILCTDEQYYASECTYTCNSGYQLTFGSRIRRCQSDHSFDGVAAICSIRQCFVAVPPLNGKVKCTDANNFQSVCTFTCNLGFELDMLDQGATAVDRTCQADAQWTNTQPICRLIRCGALLPPLDGDGHCSDEDSYGSICQFTCNTGFELSGSAERLCQATRQWTGSESRCSLIQCAALVAPVNGRMDCTSRLGVNAFGSVCNFQCNTGYSMSGSSTRTCQRLRTWSGVVTACVLITCPVLNQPLHGKVTCSNENEYGSRCSVTCDRGYLLVSGDETRNCGADETWSGKEASCQIMTCPNLVPRDHTSMTCTNGIRFGSICTFKGELGYELRGNARVECDEFGEDDPPFADLITCPAFDAPENGRISCSNKNVFDSTCYFNCDDGFEMFGSVSRNCKLDKSWSGGLVTCVQIVCPALTAPEFGSADCLANIYQSTCAFTCGNGYELVGSESRTCQSSHSWTGVAVTCVLITCGQLSSPSNGAVTCSKGGDFGSSCAFECNEGFNLVGSQLRTCRADHAWTGALTSCVLITCPLLPPLNHGKIKCSDSYNYNSDCKFVCEIGYEMSGSSNRICMEDGSWSGSLTSCGIITCDSLDAPDNGTIRCADGNNFDSACRFTCDIGYELMGSNSRTCLKSTQWSGVQTYCQSIVCPMMPSLSHGSVNCTNQNIYNSECSFSCNEGYEFFGSTKRSCQLNHEWSGIEVRCVLTTCPEISPLSNGRITCSDGNRYLSECSAACVEGYELFGSTLRSCEISHAWSGNEATCRLITCDVLKAPPNGDVACTKDNIYDSSCSLSCNEGFNLVGSRLRTCRADHAWTGALTICVLITCPELSVPSHGKKTCTDSSNYDSSCHFLCEIGYEMSGSSNRICMEDGSWSGSLTSCGIITCDSLDVPDNGTIRCADSSNFDSTCRFTCNIGYELMGSNQRTCLESTQWSGVQTYCQLITCPLLVVPSHGSVKCTATNIYESACTFSCDTGYSLVGSSSRVCQETHAWTGVKTSCVLVTCGSLTAPSHGGMICTGDSYDSECSFKCNVGFEMVGSELRTCQANGEWSGAKVACGIVMCDNLEVPDNGKKRCADSNNFDSSCRFTCNRGYELMGSNSRTCLESTQWSGVQTYCQLIRCEEMTRPSHGSVNCTNSNVFGSDCTFKCDNGYETLGSVRRSCNLDHEWSGATTTCNLITCPTLEAPPNGKVICINSNNFLSECYVECEEGYELFGSILRTCEISHAWSGIEATCRLITCGVLKAPPNGNINCSDGDSFWSTCDFNCNEGYSLSGSHSRYCQLSHAWDGIQTVCTLRTCDILSAPSHGRKTCSDADNYESDCRFICDVGYQLQGSRIRSCQADGEWSGGDASCAIVTCSELDVPENGNKRCNEDENFDSKCRFTCNIGYELIGSSIRTCLELGEWSGGLTSCQLIRCGKLGRIKHGSIKCSDGEELSSNCRHICKKGYDLVGVSSRTCQEDHTWTGSQPTCEVARCTPVILPPAHGTVSCSKEDKYESVCAFVCDEGYRLQGTLYRECRADHTWSFKQPSCEMITCEEFDFPPSVEVSCTNGMNFGSICTLIPPEGHDLEGPTVRTCDDNPTFDDWMGPSRLIVRECPVLSPPMNGGMVCTNENMYKSECQFTCNIGYELTGSTSRRCQDDTKWSGEETVCIVIDCEVIVAPKNGKMQCSNNFLMGSRCFVECFEGYQLIGNAIRTCLNTRDWDNDQSLCLGIICGAIVVPDHGSMRCSEGDHYNSVCQFTCDEGYQLGGSTSRTCLSTQVWSGVDATCTLIRCGPLEAPSYGSISCSDSDDYNSACDLSCISGYQLIGSDQRVCQANGQWSLVQPVCSIVTCPRLFNPANGVVSCNFGNKFNSVCTISCVNGFELVGTRVRICGENGQFDGSETYCRKISCRELDEIDHGSIRCVDSNKYNSMCSYVCDSGYNLVGIPSRKCMSSGDWSNSEPICERANCLNLRAPPHGSIECTDGNLSGSRCVVTCESCYSLSGSTSRTCRSDGSWSGDVMTCDVSTCRPLRAPRYGYMDCGDSIDECGTVCTFSCKEGYKLRGVETRMCKVDSRWTGSPPECISSTCRDIPPNDDVEMTCTDDSNIGSNCSFVCLNEGASLLGSKSKVCLDNGAWSKSNPICRECKTAVSDILFIIDGSWSVGEVNFRKVKDFLKALVEPFQVGWDNSRFAVVQYSDDPRVEFLMNEHFTVEDVLNAIDAIPYKGGNTNTGRALEFSLYTALVPSNGARSNVNKVALILTDGRSQDLVGNPARELRQAGVKVVAVGVGDADTQELKAIASPPYDKSVFEVEDFDSISEIQGVLSARLCESVRRQSACGCPAGPQGYPGAAGTPGKPGESIKGEKGASFSVIHINYEGQTITARNEDGSVVDVSLPEELKVRHSSDDKVFFAMPGPPGPRGPMGEVGKTGLEGPIGPSGLQGEPGPHGDKGDTGPQGEDGRMGEDGNPGAPGKQGPPGINGKISNSDRNNILATAEDMARRISLDEINRNLASMSSSRLPASIRDPRASGVRGAPGPPGPPGPPGSRGYVGFEGPQGLPGTTGTPGMKGSTGATGALGDKGARGTPGIGVMGPQGPAGPRGIRGKKGVGKTGKPGKRGPPGKPGKVVYRKKVKKPSSDINRRI